MTRETFRRNKIGTVVAFAFGCALGWPTATLITDAFIFTQEPEMKGIMGVGLDEIECLKCNKKSEWDEEIPDGWLMLAIAESVEVEDFDAAPLCPDCAAPYRHRFEVFEKKMEAEGEEKETHEEKK